MGFSPAAAPGRELRAGVRLETMRPRTEEETRENRPTSLEKVGSTLRLDSATDERTVRFAWGFRRQMRLAWALKMLLVASRWLEGSSRKLRASHCRAAPSLAWEAMDGSFVLDPSKLLAPAMLPFVGLSGGDRLAVKTAPKSDRRSARTEWQGQTVTKGQNVEIWKVVAPSDRLTARCSKNTRATAARDPAARRSRREAAGSAKPVAMAPSVRPYGREEQCWTSEGAKLDNAISQPLLERCRRVKHRLVGLEERQPAAQTA